MKIDRVAEVVAKEVDIPASDIFSDSKKRSACYARNLCIYIYHAAAPHLSQGEIAKLTGVDRTYVCRAIKKVESYCSVYRRDRMLIERVRSLLEA